MGRKKARPATHGKSVGANGQGADAAVPPRLSAEILPINKEFAERYEISKRKQLLSSVPAALLESASDAGSSSDEEDEDELGELLTKGIDRRVKETLEAIRNKDPKIYDKDTRFFEDVAKEGSEDSDGDGEDGGDESSSDVDSEDEPVAGWDAVAKAARAETPKMTLKDYVRETLLKDGKLSDDEDDGEGNGIEESGEAHRVGDEGEHLAESEVPVTSGNGAVDKGLIASGDEEESDDGEGEGGDGEDFFIKKLKSAAEAEAEEKDFEKFLVKQNKKTSAKAGEELLLHSYLQNEKPDDKERFLRDFVLNNGWLNKNAGDAPNADDYEIEIDHVDPNNDGVEEDDEEFDEKVDDFEANYNFRFEDPDSTQVMSHAREVQGSMRRPDDRRKVAREARRQRKEQEKLAKTEDIKRLKNLKKREVQSRLMAIQEAAGNGVDVSGIDLDGDFDPDKFNEQMEANFGDKYYAEKDKEMKELSKEDIAVASEKRLSGKVSADAPEEIRKDVNKMMDEYYNLDYEDIVGGVPMRFNYKKVDPESFSMTPAEILAMDDKELNRIVSLKRIAPYRANRDIKKDSWRVRDALKKQRQANRGGTSHAESDVMALARARGVAEDGDEDGYGKGAKKRRRSGKLQDGVARAQDHQTSGGARRQAEPGPKRSAARESASAASKVEQADNTRKKKRKRRSKSEVVENLSASRKEAYGLG